MVLTHNAKGAKLAGQKLVWPTIRISGIPSSLAEDEFPDILHDDKDAILGWSLCSDATTGHKIATATFRDASQSAHLKTGGATIDVDVDSSFVGLTPLSTPSAKDTTVDIIAVSVHGFESWCSPTAPGMWLRDFLPQTVPAARILTYGYDMNEPEASLPMFGRGLLEAVTAARGTTKQRPIIFVGHGVGGLVIKQALVTAAAGSNEEQNVFRSCYGLIFFGVPSTGLEHSRIRTMVAAEPNEKLASDLGTSSRFVENLHEDFYRRFTLADARIISAYETRVTATAEIKDGVSQTTGPKVVMVPKASAIHHSKSDKEHDIITFDVSHTDMVRFYDHSDPDYKTIQGHIKAMVECAPDVIRERVRGKKEL